MFVSKLGAHDVVQKLREAGSFKLTRHYGGRVRVGKTRRDHQSGSWKQRLDNRTARNA